MNRTVRRRNLKSRGHVQIAGNLVLSGYARVGGNFTVEGDLHIDGPLLCLGRLTVKGSLRAADVIVGQGMEVSGDVAAVSVDAQVDCVTEADLSKVAQIIAVWTPNSSPSAAKIDSALKWIADETTVIELQDELLLSKPAIKVGGQCTVAGWVRTVGSVDVGGLFNPDDCSVTAGNIYAETVLTEGDLDCGGLHVRRWVCVEGAVSCAEVKCSQLEAWGDAEVEMAIVATGRDTRDDQATGELPYRSIELDNDHAQTRDVLPSLRCASLKARAVTAGGSILVDGAIECAGYLRAARSITSGGAISTGKQFGILAGLDVARPKWLAAGYVCAQTKPQRILTGTYRSLAKRQRGAAPKPARLK